MTWQLVHHHVGSPCSSGVPLRRNGLIDRVRMPRGGGGLTVRNRRPSCPLDDGSLVATTLGPAVTALLHRRGIDYEPVGPSNSLLWCLGGTELYRKPDDVDELQADDCLDLQLRVCDAHRTISLELYPYDLVPERGGSGPDDPLQSEPIDLGDNQPEVIDQVMVRLESWLEEILFLSR